MRSRSLLLAFLLAPLLLLAQGDQGYVPPIEWTITSGYGASKRFLPGSALEKSLMDPPESFIHLASNTDIEEKLKARGIETLYDYEPNTQPPEVAQPEAQRTNRPGRWWKWWGH